MTQNQYVANKLTLTGDFSIAGVSEQLPLLIQHLAGMAEVLPDQFNQSLSYEIDLNGVEALDSCGCQLLAALFRKLRQKGVKVFSLQLSDDYREKIHLLGFDDEIFTGECA